MFSCFIAVCLRFWWRKPNRARLFLPPAHRRRVRLDQVRNVWQQLHCVLNSAASFLFSANCRENISSCGWVSNRRRNVNTWMKQTADLKQIIIILYILSRASLVLNVAIFQRSHYHERPLKGDVLSLASFRSVCQELRRHSIRREFQQSRCETSELLSGVNLCLFLIRMNAFYSALQADRQTDDSIVMLSSSTAL